MTGIVHLGLGNFHRAHQAVYTAAALAEEPGDWGILAAASTSRTVVSALRAQDLRYHVVELSPGRAEISSPAVHTGVLVAAEETETLVAAIAAADTRIVTLTVTEHGYSYSPETLGLDLDSAAVRHDLRDVPPRTPIGQLTRGLQRRARTHGHGVTIVSCDNLAGNGRHTRQLVREFAAALPDPELVDWIDRHVRFPNTMVDRIVPATTDETRRIVAERLGVEDAVPVPAEPFTMWVLEDDFARGRPRWEAGGAIFTGDVGAYELLKLRLLNGTHSLIAYLGLLSGAHYISDAVARPFVERAARRVIAEDYLPTFTPPEAIDVDDYVEQLFGRFSNSALAHRTSQVGSDGSLKLPQRITEPVLWHHKQGRVAGHLALTVAAYLRCVELGTEIRDPALERLRPLVARARSARELVGALFDEGQVFAPELADCGDFLDRTGRLLDILREHGPAQAAAEV
ncbi:mannitol dehydrogenase family protein [Amycolatopsis acidiphila]|uniref:Mannitol-1-phosphate 5-dehydrogenase n=1 Tax=Amycolatopsis acidiphila TaxID=715473 RepID=A0A558A4T5_9PSEU|nr:mannitol dehydrogenase family protein [Amycolatopsis acidiphila]TVT19271.1 mannitol dehydrogenase family protein [Amycolatopsis acidiphila]UIJ62302.1 mannitol dehydrogenase family protein [Amycolatopsis acidiphila]GHG96746.1 mannitol dehydrogenase [Amycolatopsis acidiphila]